MSKLNGRMLQTMASALVARSELATRIGQSYDNERDLYETLGYKLELTFNDYASQYERQDIAQAIIDRPVEATWTKGFQIREADDADTPLETAWADLEKTHALTARFQRLDRLSGLGRYGVLFLGASDVSSTEDLVQPLSANVQLLYVKAYSEGSVDISEWENDPQNERYGQPTVYELKITEPGTEQREHLMRVHYTRIIHVPGGKLQESDIYGKPRLQPVFNRLKDLEKIVGGSGEMFWRGARPGYQGTVNPDYEMGETEREGVQDEVDEYERKLRRILLLEGVKLEALAPQVEDPTAHVDVQIQMISSATGIPKRILTGSERGELASSEDRTTWLEQIQQRQLEFAEQRIIRPFVMRCMAYGILPPPQASNEWFVEWPDLWAVSDQQQAQTGQIRAAAIKAYVEAGGMDIVPPESFLRLFLGLDDDQIEQIKSEQSLAYEEEDRDFAESTEPEEGDLDSALETARSRGNHNVPETVRRQVLQRDGYKCSRCGWKSEQKSGGDTRQLELHHIKPLDQGGKNEAGNIRIICSKCHTELHVRKNKEKR